MPRTIVQEYGPIYGEPVNGTVQGRPNGSVYVPISNKILFSIEQPYLKYQSAIRLQVCNSDGSTTGNPTYSISAESQDLASNMFVGVYSDEELTTLVSNYSATAGLFNETKRYTYEPVEGLTDGQKLYMRAQLMNNGTAIATSDTIEVTMVVLP